MATMNPHTIVNERNWPAHNRDFLRFFEVKGTKWPDEGIEPIVIQNVWVWVTPRNAPLTKGRSGMKHRVICSCPDCGRDLSAARLQQHVCKTA